MNFFEAQDSVRKFIEDKNINSSVGVRIIDSASEVGELSKEFLKGADYGKKEFEKTEEWDLEIGDVLFLSYLHRKSNPNRLRKLFKHVLDKYEKRFYEKGDLSSGN